ncbi:MAG: aminoacyl-tRNA hydrolase [Turicibacter sp.]|nr:aminoacyl-tRNA hydrolase [Turicibacter sp.]
MKLFVGLGNPGRKYADTRHNVGFMVIDELARKWGVTLAEEKKFKGELGSVHVGGEKILLLKPTTYMNLSGESVQAVMDFYDLTNEDVVVIYDDLDMEVGKVRGREKGSAGGHNGIKSMILHLAGEEFKRFKIGIDKSPYGKTTDHVLGKFTTEELDDIGPAIMRVARACEETLTIGFLKAVSGLNN